MYYATMRKMPLHIVHVLYMYYVTNHVHYATPLLCKATVQRTFEEN
jgi:hypothetical protein